MKKILVLFLLLFSVQAQAAGIYTTVARGTVTQANMKISAVDGTAFVDFSAADVLTTKLGNLLKIRDSSGRAIQGFIKAAGSGETLGDELITAEDDRTFASDTGWWTKGTGWTINDAVAGKAHHAGTSYTNLSRASLTIIGALYYVAGTITGAMNFQAILIIGARYHTANSVNAAFGTSKDASTVDNVSLKQVLTPSTTGVTIVSTKGGTTYNWAQKDSSFNYNDSSGYTYEIIQVRQLPVIATHSITAGNALIDATTDNAFAAPIGVDLSPYQTGEYILALYDSSGYAAIAWISATAPSGEALGSEIITNGDMELDSTWISFNYPTGNERSTEQAHAGTYSRKIVAPGSVGIQNNEFTLTAQKLYKCAVWLYGDGTHNLAVRVRDSLVGTSFYAFGSSDTGVSVPAAWTKNTSEYFNQLLTGTSHTVRVYVGSGMSSTTFYADDISIKQVTMPAATGALLLSTKGGSRGWIYKHASFNPNAAMTYKILYAGE